MNQLYQSLYSIAQQCVNVNGNGECKQECDSCQLNVFNYCDNPKEAALIKATAQASHDKWNAYKRQERAQYAGEGLSKLIIIAIIVGIIAATCARCGL